MITIVGANGQFGHAVIQALYTIRPDIKIRGVVSNEKSATSIRESFPSLETVIGDIHSQDDMLHTLEGTEKLYYVCPALQEHEYEMGQNVLRAAKQHGVKQFVMHALPYPYIQDIPFHRNKGRLCLDIMHSGVPFTVVQPTNIMQNAAWVMPAVIQRGEFGYPYSCSQELTWLDLDDFAQAVAIVLLEKGHLYATYELASPDGPLSRYSMAEQISTVLGRKITAVELSIDDVLQAERFQRLTTYQRQALAAMFEHYDKHGFRCGSGHTLASLIGKEGAYFIDFFRKWSPQFENMH